MTPATEFAWKTIGVGVLLLSVWMFVFVDICLLPRLGELFAGRGPVTCLDGASPYGGYTFAVFAGLLLSLGAFIGRRAPSRPYLLTVGVAAVCIVFIASLWTFSSQSALLTSRFTNVPRWAEDMARVAVLSAFASLVALAGAWFARRFRRRTLVAS
jgi:hypothetical protein